MNRFFGFSACALIVSCASVLCGCASVRTDVSKYSPAAVVCVYGNSSLPWYVDERDKVNEYDGDDGGIITGTLNRLLGKKNPEFQTVHARIDYAAESLCRQLREHGIEVVDHNVMVKTPLYRRTRNNFMNTLSDDVSAAGYKIMSASAPKRNRQFAKEMKAACTVFVIFKFQKQLVNQYFSFAGASARVTMTVYIADRDGKKIVGDNYYVISEDSTPYQTGKWNRQAVCDMFPDTIDAVIAKFLADYTGKKVQSSTAGEESLYEDGTAEATMLSIPATVKEKIETSAEAPMED